MQSLMCRSSILCSCEKHIEMADVSVCGPISHLSAVASPSFHHQLCWGQTKLHYYKPSTLGLGASPRTSLCLRFLTWEWLCHLTGQVGKWDNVCNVIEALPVQQHAPIVSYDWCSGSWHSHPPPSAAMLCLIATDSVWIKRSCLEIPQQPAF